MALRMTILPFHNILLLNDPSIAINTALTIKRIDSVFRKWASST
jgi:hypothetical protein